MARGLNRWACAVAAVVLLGLAVPHRGEGWDKVWGIEDPYDNVKSLYFSHVPPYPPLLAWGTEQGPPVDGDNPGRAYVSTDLLDTYRELPLIPYADPGVEGLKFVQDFTVNPGYGALLFTGTNNWGVFSIGLDFRETWTQHFVEPRQANAMASGYDGSNWAYWAGFQGQGIYKSDSVGAPWRQTLPDGEYVHDLDYDSETKTLYAATLNGVRVSEDGGGSWVRHSLIGTWVYAVAMDPHAPRTVWAGTQHDGIFRSTDGGATWVPASHGLPGEAAEDYPEVWAILADPNSSGATTATLFIGTTGHGIWTSANGGESWTQSFPTTYKVEKLALDPGYHRLYAAVESDGIHAADVPCTMWCTAAVPAEAAVGCPVPFRAASGSECAGGYRSFAWSFGDGHQSGSQDASHAYGAPGSYPWSFLAAIGVQSCTRSGMIHVFALPGDCNEDAIVTIGEIQKAVNMFLGIEPVGCGADCNADGSVSIGEVQKVINAFLGVARSGGFLAGPTPSLSLGAAEGGPGQTASVPVTMGGNGASVAAAAYRVTYDTNLLTFAGATVGGAGSAAGKEVAVNGAQPGVVVLGILGTNRNLIGDGTLATLSFTIRSGATGVAVLSGTCGASDAEGNDLPTVCAQGSVTVPTLRGTVTLGGAGLAGVTVAAGPYSVVTDASGAWAAGGVAAGSYTVMPSRAGYAFAPASRSVAFGGGVLSGLDFAASEDFTISGGVTFMDAGTPVPGVALSASRAEGGAYAATTDASGAFRFSGLPSGSYTVTPSKADTLFSPESFGAVPLSGEWPAEEGVPFRAYPSGPYRISGFVRQDGAPLAGARLRLDGWPQEATANELGYYAIESLAAGYDYAVLPSMRCKRFDPAYLNVFGLAGDVGGQHFAASPVQLCQPCFGALDLEMARCLGSPDPAACSEGARLRFTACLDEATRNANSALFGATMLAIAVPRATGQPVPVTVPLAVAEEGDYFINVANGDQANKETMVSSATVDLSGAGRVFGPNDFNKTVPFLSAPVHLLPGAYELTVEVRSQPESYLTLVVSDADFGTLPPEGE